MRINADQNPRSRQFAARLQPEELKPASEPAPRPQRPPVRHGPAWDAASRDGANTRVPTAERGWERRWSPVVSGPPSPIRTPGMALTDRPPPQVSPAWGERDPPVAGCALTDIPFPPLPPSPRTGPPAGRRGGKHDTPTLVPALPRPGGRPAPPRSRPRPPPHSSPQHRPPLARPRPSHRALG